MRIMRRLCIGLIVAGIAWLSVRVAEAAQSRADTGSSDVLCAPRLQLRHSRFCPSNGPGGARAELARQGQLPRPLPLVRLDPNLGQLPFMYRRVSSEGTKIYGSPDDAAEKKDAYNELPPGFIFVSYDECQMIDNEAIYMISSGAFIRGGSACSALALPEFRGLTFSRTPDRPFGWILGTQETRRAAGASQPSSGRTRYRTEVIQIYDEQESEGEIWYRIGPDEWINQLHVARVEPDPIPPDGVDSNRWISINLFEQTIAAYEDGALVFATMTSTGLPGWWTQPGLFQVYERLERDDMTGAFEADRSDYYLLEDVPWVLYFDKARALHGAYCHNGYGYPRSHGCVNLSPTDAHWLYDWAEVGTWVYVFDPSGKTPVDPEAYGSGGV
jgi:hypothetical protein